jgi:ribosomal protein S27E
MVTTTVNCDQCNEVITLDRSTLTVQCGPLRRRMESVDLCPTCAATWAESLGKPATLVSFVSSVAARQVRAALPMHTA